MENENKSCWPAYWEGQLTHHHPHSFKSRAFRRLFSDDDVQGLDATFKAWQYGLTIKVRHERSGYVLGTTLSWIDSNGFHCYVDYSPSCLGKGKDLPVAMSEGLRRVILHAQREQALTELTAVVQRLMEHFGL